MRYELLIMDQSGSVFNERCQIVCESPIPTPSVGEQLMAPEAGFLDVTERTFYYLNGNNGPTLLIELRCREATREPKRH